MLSRKRAACVLAVDPASPVHGTILPGDRLLAINGAPVRDALDLAFLAADEQLDITCERDGAPRGAVSVSLKPGQNLGIEIEPLTPRRCRNRCVFCFIDQNPTGLRDSLYVKDEDLRLSFTHGHYITASSLTADDRDRIIEQRLSPLYISVHATDHPLRCRMLGIDPKNAPHIMDQMRDLAENHIDFHTQIVLCPGWNDGLQLDRALDDLESLGDALLSVAVVPVGLTEHRDALEPLREVTPDEARAVIEQVLPRQESYLESCGERVVLLSDEFYLLAEMPLPEYSEDEIACQIENGVGMIAEFYDDWHTVADALPKQLSRPTRFVLLTGKLGAEVLGPLACELEAVANLDLQIQPVENRLYGAGVTVSGLLGGADLDGAIACLTPMEDGDNILLLPANALREDGVFLDDWSIDDLRKRHPAWRIVSDCQTAGAIARQLFASQT